MLVALLYCLTMGWAPAPGPVATYTVFLDGVVHQSGIAETEISVCLSDTEPHTVTVKAFDLDGISGPMSDESEIIQMEIVPPFYEVVLPLVVQADLDGSGVVGYRDFGLFTKVFGKCHDERVEVPCP